MLSFFRRSRTRNRDDNGSNSSSGSKNLKNSKVQESSWSPPITVNYNRSAALRSPSPAKSNYPSHLSLPASSRSRSSSRENAPYFQSPTRVSSSSTHPTPSTTASSYSGYGNHSYTTRSSIRSPSPSPSRLPQSYSLHTPASARSRSGSRDNASRTVSSTISNAMYYNSPPQRSYTTTAVPSTLMGYKNNNNNSAYESRTTTTGSSSNSSSSSNNTRVNTENTYPTYSYRRLDDNYNLNGTIRASENRTNSSSVASTVRPNVVVTTTNSTSYPSVESARNYTSSANLSTITSPSSSTNRFLSSYSSSPYSLDQTQLRNSPTSDSGSSTNSYLDDIMGKGRHHRRHYNNYQQQQQNQKQAASTNNNRNAGNTNNQSGGISHNSNNLHQSQHVQNNHMKNRESTAKNVRELGEKCEKNASQSIEGAKNQNYSLSPSKITTVFEAGESVVNKTSSVSPPSSQTALPSLSLSHAHQQHTLNNFGTATVNGNKIHSTATQLNEQIASNSAAADLITGRRQQNQTQANNYYRVSSNSENSEKLSPSQQPDKRQQLIGSLHNTNGHRGLDVVDINNKNKFNNSVVVTSDEMGQTNSNSKAENHKDEQITNFKPKSPSSSQSPSPSPTTIQSSLLRDSTSGKRRASSSSDGQGRGSTPVKTVRFDDSNLVTTIHVPTDSAQESSQFDEIFFEASSLTQNSEDSLKAPLVESEDTDTVEEDGENESDDDEEQVTCYEELPQSQPEVQQTSRPTTPTNLVPSVVLTDPQNQNSDVNLEESQAKEKTENYPKNNSNKMNMCDSAFNTSDSNHFYTQQQQPQHLSRERIIPIHIETDENDDNKNNRRHVQTNGDNSIYITSPDESETSDDDNDADNAATSYNNHNHKSSSENLNKINFPIVEIRNISDELSQHDQVIHSTSLQNLDSVEESDNDEEISLQERPIINGNSDLQEIEEEIDGEEVENDEEEDEVEEENTTSEDSGVQSQNKNENQDAQSNRAQYLSVVPEQSNQSNIHKSESDNKIQNKSREKSPFRNPFLEDSVSLPDIVESSHQTSAGQNGEHSNQKVNTEDKCIGMDQINGDDK